MLFFSRRSKKSLAVEVAGLQFANPVGFASPDDSLKKCLRAYSKAGFITLTPPREGILEWIRNLQDFRENTLLAVNIDTDILRTFSLVYDFADFIILDPDTDNGIGSADLSDMTALIDEVVSLRLCYERYTPIFLRLSPGETPDEIQPLCACARLGGLDGIVAPNPQKVRLTVAECQGRLPVVGMAQTPETALSELQEGAVLVETSCRPIPFTKLLKTLEKPVSQP